MKILIGIIIVIVVIYIFFFKGSMPLLKVKITSSDGLKYYVTFDELHPDTNKTEYIRIVLHFIAKMLLINQNKNIENEIISLLKKVSISKNLSQDSFSSNPITIQEGISSGKTITAKLLFVDIKRRFLKTNIPVTFFENQLLDSIISLIKCSAKNLSDFNLKILQLSIKELLDFNREEEINMKNSKDWPDMTYDKAFASPEKYK